MDSSPPGSSVHGIVQARILEWVAISSSRGSSWLRDQTHVSWFVYHWHVDSLSLCYLESPILHDNHPYKKTVFAAVFKMDNQQSESEVPQSCLTLCNPVDSSPPGSSIHGIFQARILEWVAISFSERSSWPRDWTQVSRIVGGRFTVWATRENHQGPTI